MSARLTPIGTPIEKRLRLLAEIVDEAGVARPPVTPTQHCADCGVARDGLVHRATVNGHRFRSEAAGVQSAEIVGVAELTSPKSFSYEYDYYEVEALRADVAALRDIVVALVADRRTL